MQSLMLLNSADLEKAQGIKNKVLNGNDNTQEKKDILFSAKRPTQCLKNTLKFTIYRSGKI